MNRPSPIEIKKIGTEAIAIKWQGGKENTLEAALLRRNCPCAGCREARGDASHERPLDASPVKKRSLNIVQSELKDELRINQIWAVGNYAIGIAWGDGHDTGIYPYELLKALTPQTAPSP